MLGCTPKGRYTEQHDIFFGIGNSLKELIPTMKDFWPEAKGRIHIDAWQKVTSVDGFQIEVVSKENAIEKEGFTGFAFQEIEEMDDRIKCIY